MQKPSEQGLLLWTRYLADLQHFTYKNHGHGISREGKTLYRGPPPTKAKASCQEAGGAAQKR